MQKNQFILEKTVEDFNKKERLFSPKSKIIIALSGGIDSVVLFYFFYKLKEQNKINDLSAVHINHNLRNEALRDQNFCVNLCKKMSVEIDVFSKDITKFSKENRLSLEEAGRVFRYKKLEETLKNKNFDFVATAHHRDDNVESFFINLFNGTGLKGASAIAPKLNDKFIRPFLNVSKEEIYNYAKENNIEFVVDHTNFESEYYRNKIRNIIIPKIKEVEENFEKKIASFINISKEIDEYLIQKEKAQISKDIFNNEVILRENLENTPPSILQYKLKEQLIKWGLTEGRTQIWENIFQLLKEKKTGEIPLKNGDFICLDSDGIRKKIEFEKQELIIEKEFISSIFNIFGNEFKITLNKTDENIYFLFVYSQNGLKEEIELNEQYFPYKIAYRFDGAKNIKGKKIKEVFVKKRIPMSYKDFWPILFNNKNEAYKILFIKRWN